ncbi:MAG: VCBS repeat-containing protein [Roseivirga sp.]|nr:VCBS repeat-containing protein [Roseivirga sp.]
MPKRLIPFLAVWLMLSCTSEPAEPPQPRLFSLLTSASTGVSFNNQLKETADFNILEYLYYYNGAGVAVGDINGDGLPDLYFVGNQVPNKLYLNKGGFRFEDISVKAGVAGKGTWSTGVTMADVNGDGLLDIYVSQVGDYKEAKGANQLFINQGDMTFVDEAKKYGLDFVGFSTQAAFFDYDRDGDLDMYLLNHSIKNPAVFAESSTRDKIDELGGDRLFQSQLAQGSDEFTDVTSQAGIYSSALGFGLGLAISDLNNDGWLDIYVSNDFTENDYLYTNNQDGTFSEELEQKITYTSRYSMGNAADDLDNDGLSEIITTDMLPSDPEIWQMSVGEDKTDVYDIKLNFGYAHQYVRNTLQKNLGNGSFSDVSLLAGTFATDWSWAPLAFDMDNDGLLDLHISNGIYKRPNDLDYVNYGQDQPGVKGMSPDELEAFQIENLPNVKIPNYAGRNKGGLQFESVGVDWGLDQSSYSNGSAYADLDNDGDLDLVINNTNQPAFVYKNNARQQNGQHFLKVVLEGTGLNKQALGAKVTVRKDGQRLTREVMPTRGFQSAVSTELHFGLGATTQIDGVTVIWPDGQFQTIEQVTPDQVLKISYAPEGDGIKPAETNKSAFQINEFEQWAHKENVTYKDYNNEYLIPRKFSTEGPALAVADVNGDGLDDMYLGGAKEQPGALWLQQANGGFKLKPIEAFEQLSRAEDADALFFDADNDGDQDLYVVSAGNEYNNGQVFTFDRLYLNDGQGNLQFAPSALPQFGTHGKTVSAVDIDSDGDLDLFVGANIVKGIYGLNPAHHLLINDGTGNFADQTGTRIPMANQLGMLNDATWFDYDQDGDEDLLVAGEWTPLTLLQNNGKGQFTRATTSGLENSEGWWFSLALADVDADGDLDIIAGNMGLNSKLKATESKPLSLYLNDFDQNGQVDPVLFHFMGEAEIPFASRDDLIKQMAFIKKKHPDYKTYAGLKKPEDLFGAELLERSLKKHVKTFASAVFINNRSGSFTRIDLPTEAQLSPVMDILADDFNADGHLDLFLVGNLYAFRNDIGRAAANPVTYLIGDGKGSFQVSTEENLNNTQTWGDYRNAAFLNGGSSSRRIIALRNNNKPVVFLLKQR